MANITFRLPGREQYSYAEVSVTSEEIEGPEGENFLGETLATALAVINLAYPQAEARPAAAAPAPVVDGPSCQHGARKHAKGSSIRGEWQALFCQSPKGQGKCPAVWLKAGEPGWVY